MRRFENLILGITSSYVCFFINMVANFIMVPILLHYIGATKYGIWITITSIIGYVGILDFGIGYATNKFVSDCYALKNSEKLNKVIATALAVYSILSGFVLLVVVIISFFAASFLGLTGGMAKIFSIAFLIVGANIALSFPSNVFGSILYGYQKIMAFNIINIIGIVLNFIFLIWSLHFGYDLIGIALALLLSGLFIAAIRVLYVKREFGQAISISLKLFDKKLLLEILSFSLLVFLTSMGGQIVFNTDNIVIAKILGVGMVTAYAIALRLNQVAMSFVFKFSDVFFPFIAEFTAIKDKDKLITSFMESTRFSVALASVIFLILVLWGRQIISYWVGINNFVGLPVFYILVLIMLMSCIVHPGAVALQSMGKVKAMVGFNIAEASLNLLFSIILAFKIGVFGVALGTLIAMGLSNFWYIPYRACREMNIRLSLYFARAVALPIALAIIIMAVAFCLESFIGTPNLLIVLIKSAILFVMYFSLFIGFGIEAEKRKLYFSKLKYLILSFRYPPESSNIIKEEML